MTHEELREAVAKAFCTTWGYEWDGDPDDNQTAPETCVDIVPGKTLYREAATAALSVIRSALMEPTPEMGEAYEKLAQFSAIHNYGASPSAGETWDCMLTASPLTQEMPHDD